MSETKNDIGAIMAKVCYNRSDKANSPQNQNPDWQYGYAVGMHAGDSMTDIQTQWKAIGSPEIIPESFREWKQGYWAAKFQKTLAELNL